MPNFIKNIYFRQPFYVDFSHKANEKTRGGDFASPREFFDLITRKFFDLIIFRFAARRHLIRVGIFAIRGYDIRFWGFVARFNGEIVTFVCRTVCNRNGFERFDLFARKPRDNPFFVLFKAYITYNRGDERAYAIDDYIFHSIGESRMPDKLSSVRQSVFLHIETHKPVGDELVNFPHRADRYGKTKGEKTDEEGRQAHERMFVAV